MAGTALADVTPAAGSRGRSAAWWRRALGGDLRRAAFTCLLLGLVATAAAWASPASRWVGYAGDPQQTMWYLRWTPYALGHGLNPLTTDNMLYPGGANLMWNTPVVLVGLLLAPVTLTLGPVAAYNLAMLLAFAASGLAAYLALRRFTGPGLAALAGAGLYELSPYTASHALGQLNMTVAVAPPLVLLLLHETFAARRWSARRTGALLGLVAAGQLMVSEEQLAASGVAALVLVVVLAASLAVHRRLRGEDMRPLLAGARRLAAVLAWSFVAFAPLAAFPLVVQFAGPQVVHGPVQRAGNFANDLLSLVVPTQSQLVAPQPALSLASRFSGNPAEWAGYLGLPLLVLLGWVAWRHRHLAAARAAAITGAVLWLLSLGPTLHVAGHDTGWPLPFGVLERVPLLGDMLPGRLSLLIDLAAAVLVAYAVRDALGRWRSVRSPIALGWVAAVLAATLPAIPLPTDTGPMPGFFTSGAAQRLPAQGSVLVVPFTTDFASSQPLLWQAEAGMGFRMPGGYAMVPGPGGRARIGPEVTGLAAQIAAAEDGGVGYGSAIELLGQEPPGRADLRRWQVRAIVLGPTAHRDLVETVISRAAGCGPDEVDGVLVWWTIQPGGGCYG